jgi:hypothetical protein
MDDIQKWDELLRNWDPSSRIILTDIDGEACLLLSDTKSSIELSLFLVAKRKLIENEMLKPWPIIYKGIVHREHLSNTGSGT